MVLMDESENPFLRLYMRQLSLSWDVLSNILNRLYTVGRAWTILTPDLRLQVLEEEELSIDQDLRASIDEGKMPTPYVTVRGVEPTPSPQPKEPIMATEDRRSLAVQQDKPQDADDKPPQAEKEEPKPIKLDAEAISDLLDVVHDTADLPSLLALNQAAMINLSIMAAEVQEELNKRAEEAKKKGEELEAKIAAWKAKKAKEREKEEKEAKEKADAA